MPRQPRPFVVIACVLIALIGILNIFSQTILGRSFATLEEQSVRRDLGRALSTVASDLDGLNGKATDWATWDAMYEFVQGGNHEFANTDITALALQNLDIDLMLFLEPDGTLILGKAVDLTQGVEIPLPLGVKDFLADRETLNIILQNVNSDHRLTGVVLLRETPLMIAARPILTSEGQGPAPGLLIFGHYLDHTEAGEMSATIHLPLTFQRSDQLPLPDDFQIAAGQISEANPFFVHAINNETVTGFASLRDISGKPAVLLRIEEPREIYQQGQTAVRYFALASVAIGAVFLGIAHLLLNRLFHSRRKLSESEERYRAVIEQASDGIFLYEAATLRVVEANAAFFHLLGSEARVAEALTFGEVFDAEQPTLTDIHARILRERVVEMGEQRVRRRDGRTFYVEASASVITYGKREVICAVMRDITERKQAAEEAERLNRQIQLILEAAGEGIFGLNADGDHTFVNPVAARILGYTADELIGHHSHTLWHYARPDGTPYPAEDCPVYATLQDGSIHYGEEHFWRKDGSGLPVEFTSTPIRESETVVGAVVTFRDITKRKQAEDALKDSEKRFRALIENGLDNISLLAPDGTLLWESPAVIRNLGYAPDEFVGRNIFELMHPDDMDWTRALYVALLEEPGSRLHGSFRLRHSDGSWRWTEAVAANLLHEPGINAIVINYRDITERKQAEQQLEASEKRFRALIENISDVIVVVDAEGVIKYLSPSSHHVLGLSPADLLDQDAFRFVHPDDVEQAAAAFAKTLQQPELSATISVRFRYADGTWHWVEVVGTNGFSEPSVQGMIITVRDITERKQAEAELAATNARLEQAVWEANQLAMAAQAANRLKSEILANTSHELRTPLTGILGSLGLVLEGLCDTREEERSFIVTAYQASHNLLELINNLLELAKIEAGKMEVELQPVDLALALAEVETLTRPQAQEKGLTLRVTEVREQTLWAQADPEKVRQILLNVVNNALKFTEQGEVELAAQTDRRAGVVRLTVRDTGIGVSLEQQAKLFQPFVQVDGTSTRRYGGTGLGLSLSRQFAELMNGSLTLESAGEGQGCTLTLTLPCGTATGLPLASGPDGSRMP